MATSKNHDLSSAIVPFDQSTYVVQMPKDQIFRVPPPENARIVEEHKKKLKNRKGSNLCSRFACVPLVLLLLLSLALAALVIFYFVSKPSMPVFSVDSVQLVRPTSTEPEFDIMLNSENPSSSMKLYYKNGGSAYLHHGRVRIASGDPPRFDIGRKGKTQVQISLVSSKAKLPNSFASPAKGRARAVVVPLSLLANFPMKLSLGPLQMRNKAVGVNCDLKVRKMAMKLSIVSQNCKSKS